MTKLTLFILLTITLQKALAQKTDIEILTKLNQAWLDSSIKKDTATLAQIFAEDFILISPNGAKRTKQEAVRNIFYQDLASIHIDSSDVRLLTKDVGLITCYLTFVFKNEGKEVIGKNCYQDVYVKRKGRWLAVAAHITLLNAK